VEKEFKIITEGVLVLASSSALKDKYNFEEFDYDFPNGFSDLSDSNSIIALTTSEGDDLQVIIQSENSLQKSKYDKVITQYLNIQKSDELLILSHAEFIMICNRKNGDYKEYGWPIKFKESIESGQYKVELGIKDVSEEFEKYQAYFVIKINIERTSDTLTPNEVFDIGH